MHIETDNEVILLSTLHQFHAELTAYSLQALEALLYKLAPQVICVELSPTMLVTRPHQEHKLEYEAVILPYADAHSCTLYPMEPDEPERSALVQANRALDERVRREQPERVTAFEQFTGQLYPYLFKEFWDSPMAVHSEATDVVFEIKHRFQSQVFGQEERQLWDEWNTCFLTCILEANRLHRGQRIVVTAGAEHRYWLRKALKVYPEVTVIDLAEGLA